MTFQERVLNALPFPPAEVTIAALAAKLDLKDAERPRLAPALHRLKAAGHAQNSGRRGPASAWSAREPRRAAAAAANSSPARALPAPAAPPPEPFQAAIDHRGRIAVRADGVGVQIRPADALELLAFLQQMEDVIAFQAKEARK